MIYESLQSKDCRLFLFLVVDAMVDVSLGGKARSLIESVSH